MFKAQYKCQVINIIANVQWCTIHGMVCDFNGRFASEGSVWDAHLRPGEGREAQTNS